MKPQSNWIALALAALWPLAACSQASPNAEVSAKSPAAAATNAPAAASGSASGNTSTSASNSAATSAGLGAASTTTAVSGAAGSTAGAAAAQDAQAPKATLVAPDVWVSGGRYVAKLTLAAGAQGASVEGWRVTPAGFQVNGAALAQHGDVPAVALAANELRDFDVDLGPLLKASADFELAYGSDAPLKVRVLEPAPAGLKFMDESAMPVAELEKYWVVLDTVRGTMVCEMFPAVAPGHARNFLDLSASGFYNGTIFHRVGPGFMIQGGDPTGTGTGSGPRMLKAEFTRYKKHLPGTLSMARSSNPDSASCQFFIMHGVAAGLDGQYSIFGNLVRGFGTLDKIVRSKGQAGPDGTVRPKEQQVIVKATVVKVPANPDEWREGPDGKPLKKAEPAPTAK